MRDIGEGTVRFEVTSPTRVSSMTVIEDFVFPDERFVL